MSDWAALNYWSYQYEGLLQRSQKAWREREMKTAEQQAAALRQARIDALEEAARAAEREGVYPELNVAHGGPDWYRHGKDIAAAIRALKEKQP